MTHLASPQERSRNLAPTVALAFLLAAQAPLRAQGGPPGRLPTPGGIPRPGGAGPGAAPTTPMEPPDLEAVLAKGATFPNASIINVVLPWYKGITGKRVVLDTNIADNNVQMVFEGPISKPDLGDFITRTLLLNGYVFLETDRADTLKLVMADKMRSEPDRYFREGDVLPDNEEVITYVMNLKCIKPEEAIRVIPQVVQLHPYGALAAVPNAYVGRYYQSTYLPDGRLARIEPIAGFPARVVVVKENHNKKSRILIY